MERQYFRERHAAPQSAAHQNFMVRHAAPQRAAHQNFKSIYKGLLPLVKVVEGHRICLKQL